MLKKNILLALLVGTSAIALAKQVEVVTTTSTLASIVEIVGAEHTSITAICTGKQDPHHLQARPKYVMMARNADLWIRTGMDLEIGWEMPVINGSRNRNIRPGQSGHLDTSEQIQKLEVPDAGMLSRAMGDVHAQGNPHYLIDPENAKIVSQVIAERLGMLDPEHAAVYAENAAAFGEEIDRRMVDWKAQMEPLNGKSIVTYHKSWIYFTNRFGIDIAIELEPKPGVPPSPSHLTQVVETVRAKQIGIILQEPWYSTKAAKRVADKTDARIVIAPTDTGGDPEGNGYFELIDLIINRITED
ncbi:metal ABC transporter substrate-binding protein [Pontiellaceae bacterium B12219]|nr:metal ABC transporter substrate-binding protein [Pontiellaceae bacterium B12219]